MAYSVPFQFSHGDYPTAARMNLYKDGLDAIYALTGSYPINMFVCKRTGTVQGFYFVHRLRWLIFRNDSAGRIEDPAGVGATVTLEVSGAEWTSYDLDQVDWMIPGKLYQVQALFSCFENAEALA